MGGPDAEGQHLVPVVHSWRIQVATISVWSASNIGLNYFNKWALQQVTDTNPDVIGFALPYFYTMFHMLCSSITALIMMISCDRPEPGGLPNLTQLWTYKFLLVPLAACTVVSMGLNSASLVTSSVGRDSISSSRNATPRSDVQPRSINPSTPVIKPASPPPYVSTSYFPPSHHNSAG